MTSQPGPDLTNPYAEISASGLPVTGIDLAGPTALGTDVLGPDGAAHHLTWEVRPVSGSVGLRPPEEFSALRGPDSRIQVPLVDALVAFWHLCRPGADGDPPVAAAVRRVRVTAPDAYAFDLSDGSTLRVGVSVDGRPTAVAPEPPVAVDLGLLAGSVSTLHVLRTLGLAALRQPVPVQARSVEEAGAYLEEAFGGRGATIDWRREVHVMSTTQPGEHWLRFERRTAERAAVVEIHVPPGFVDPPADEMFLSYGRGRSTLLDADQWLQLELDHGLDAAESFRLFADGMTATVYNQTFKALRFAVGATDQLLAFLPDGRDEPGDDAFWTERGRQRRAENAELYRRDRIEERADHYRAATRNLVARHGPDAP